MEKWKDIRDGMEMESARALVAPLVKKSFLRAWNSQLPTLHFFPCGRDFCDTCTTLGNSIMTAMDSGTSDVLVSACL